MERLCELDIYNLSELPKEKWIKFGDGRTMKAYLGNVELLLEGEEVEVETLIASTESKDECILGIDFLKQNQKKLVLDFRSQHYELS